MESVAPPEGFAERRRAPRHEVFLAARLDTPTRSRVSITQDLSATGARLLSIGRFQPGEPVEVWMLIGGTRTKVRATGKVVHAKPYSVSGPWRCQLAVQFDEPLAENEYSRLLAEVPEAATD
ncbi:MAG: PilZ domain-containing protein [Deltaproteobacteria bacterium]|nr:PilZ domain-containing protein [Deltaproteobacteria bacterium]